MALAGLAYLVRDWRKLSIIMAIPAIPFVLGWLWVDIYFLLFFLMSIDSNTSPYRDLQQLTTATFFPYDSQHHKRLLLHEIKFNLFIEFISFSQSYSRVSEMVSCEGKNWKSRTNPLQGCQIQQETNTSRTATGLWETATGRLAGLVQDARYDSQNTHILVLLVNALCFFFLINT